MLITIAFTLFWALVAIVLLTGALIKGGKNLLQKIIAFVGLGGKVVMDLLLTNIVRIIIFGMVGITSAIVITLIAIVIVII